MSNSSIRYPTAPISDLESTEVVALSNDLIINQPDSTRKTTLASILSSLGIMRCIFFSKGGALESQKDTAFCEEDGKLYIWNGPYPKLIEAGSTPETSGGVGPSAWVSTRDNASFVRIWKYRAVADGETTIQLPTDIPVVNVQTIYIQGLRQDLNEGFTYNADDHTITLADELEAGDLVTVIIGIANPDAGIDIFAALKRTDGASNVGTNYGGSVQDVLSDLLLKNQQLTDKLASNNGASNIGTLDGITVEDALSNNAANIREHWRRQLSDAGLNLVDGSFEEGATVTTSTDAVWHIAVGKCYTWDGAFPKTVPANSTPDSTGGVKLGAWVSVGDVSLRSQISNPEGASFINTSDGDSVQVHLDAIESAAQATTNLIKETNSVIPPDYSRQLIIGVTDRAGEASAEIRADAGKGEASPIPQGIATDPVTGEFFITRGWDETSPVYVHIYDRNFNFLKVVRAGGGWGEGIVIGYVNGERRIAVSRASAGYAVYSLPATEDITGLNSATLLFEQTSANQEAQLSSYGNYVTIRCSHLGDDQYIRRSLYSVYNLQEFLTTPDPVRKSFIHFPSDQMSGGIDTNFLVTKCQATCLSPRGMASHNGQTWHTVNANRELPGYRLRFIEVSHGGDVITNQLLHPQYVLAEYASKGWTRPLGQPLDNTEPEGICYSNEYGYVWLTVISERVFITTQYNPVLAAELDSNRNLDLRAAALPQSNNPGSVRSVSANAPIDDTSGIALTTPDQIVDMMRARNLRHYSCTLNNGLTFGSASFTGKYNMAEFTLVDGNQCIATITLERSTVHQFFASGNTPRRWMYSAVQYGGTTSDQVTGGRTSMIQIAPNNFGQIRVVTAGTGNHTPMHFISNQTATVGSITMTSTATAFNTTSDERLKVLHGNVPDALSIIESMINDGAVQMAAFKADPDKIYPMLIAQRVAKFCDFAVTKGDGEYGEEGFIPDMVDYSKLVPLLFAAIMQLKAKLDECESK